MTALYIILGIIAFFVIVLSIPVVLDLEYTDAVRCKVSWLFLKFDLYPFPEKKAAKTGKSVEDSLKEIRKRRSQKRRKKKNRSPRRKFSSRPFTIIRAWRELSSFSTTAWRHLNDSRSNSLSVPL